MATLCPKVLKDQMLSDPPPCHVEKVLNDWMLHRCRLSAVHHGEHLCYPQCDKEWKQRKSLWTRGGEGEVSMDSALRAPDRS